MTTEEKRLLLAVAQAVLNNDPYVAAGLRARIQRLMETMGVKDAN